MPRTSDSQSTFRAHVERLQAEYLPLRLSEADTRSYLVDPVLRLLGYAGVKHLRREVPVPATKEFIDYELLIDGKPHAIVEAKAMRHRVTSQHAAQCVQYASVLGVRWCLITNGIMWALYDAHAKGPLDEKRVAEVRLDGDAAATEHAWTVLALFSREAVAASSPLTTLLIERVLADELSKPDSKAVSELRRAVRQRFGERVTGSAVVDALLRWGQRMAHTAVPAGPSERDTAGEAPGPPQAREKRRQARAQRPAAGSRSSRRVTLADLIEASLLPPNAALEARVQGVSHIARVRDGAIDLDGTRYETPSAASIALRQTKSWNGWVDWHYKGKSLADLREQLRGRRSAESHVT